MYAESEEDEETLKGPNLSDDLDEAALEQPNKKRRRNKAGNVAGHSDGEDEDEEDEGSSCMTISHIFWLLKGPLYACLCSK